MTHAEVIKAEIDAICRDRALAPVAKLDALDEIRRYALKGESKIRAAIRRARKGGTDGTR